MIPRLRSLISKWFLLKTILLYILNLNYSKPIVSGHFYYIYIYIYIYIYHVPLARILLTHSRHSPLLSITPGRSSRPNNVLVQSCCRYVQAGHPTLARLWEGVHRSISFMSSFSLLLQCSAYLVLLIWMVFEMDGSSAAVLWDVTFRICSIQLVIFLCKCRQAFSPYAQWASMWCIHIEVLTRPRLEKVAFYFIGEVWLPYER